MNRYRVLAISLACLGLPFAVSQARAQKGAEAAGPAQPRQAAALPAEDQAARVFKALDSDGNGTLTLAEFRAGWQQLQRVESQVRLRQQFSVVDLDRSGSVEAGEYAQLRLVRHLGEQAPPLSRFDADGDGKLGFEEYARLVQALVQRETGKDGAE